MAFPFFSFSFSVSLLLLSFFLPSCLSFSLSFGSLLLSLSLFLLSSLLLLHEKNNIKRFNCNFFFHQFFLFFWSPVLFFLSNPFRYLRFCFPNFKLCFLFNMNVFGFKTNNLKKHNFWSKGGLQQNNFFHEPVFCKMSKVIVFLGGHFLGKFWVMFKDTIKIGISAHF